MPPRNRYPFWLLLIVALFFTAACKAVQTDEIAETIAKSNAQEIKGTNFWIAVMHAKKIGTIIRLNIDLGVKNPEGFGPTNALKPVVEARFVDGRSVPAKFFTCATVNGLAMADYLVVPDDRREISSVNVAWQNVTKNFKLMPTPFVRHSSTKQN